MRPREPRWLFGGDACPQLSGLRRRRSLGLNRLDPSDQSTILADFTGRIKSFRLRLKPQTKQDLGRFLSSRIELLIAHFVKFSQ